MSYRKTASTARGLVLHGYALNVRRHPSRDGRQKAFHFIRLALDDQLHIAAGQIANLASHCVAGRQLLGGVAEADPLHAAGVVHALSDKHDEPLLRVR